MTTYRYIAMKDRKQYIKLGHAEKLINYFFERGGAAIRRGKHTYIQSYEDAHIRFAYLLFSMWRTGRRVSEIVGLDRHHHNIDRCPGLRPCDIDRENREITFHILKKLPVRERDRRGLKRPSDKVERERRLKPPYVEVFTYDDEFFDALVAYVDQLTIGPYDRIFPYHRVYVHRKIAEACKRLNINLGHKKVFEPISETHLDVPILVTPHKFRHGFSLNFLNRLRNDPRALPMLKQILAHSSISVTETYTQFDQQDRREALNEVYSDDDDV